MYRKIWMNIPSIFQKIFLSICPYFLDFRVGRYVLLLVTPLWNHLSALKALFSNVSTLQNMSCMALHAPSVCDRV